jgi:hypothetical protein
MVSSMSPVGNIVLHRISIYMSLGRK